MRYPNVVRRLVVASADFRSRDAAPDEVAGPLPTEADFQATEVLGANTVTIVAVDRAGNASAPSNAITVTTNWAPGGCGL
jgi:hypothetical protein